MAQFFIDLFNPNLSFLLYSSLVGLLSSFAFGVMGTFVVIKRISFIAGAIAHCILGGIGLGLYLQGAHGISWFGPELGAILMAIVAAIVIGFFSLYFKEREDTLIGALWAFGMALGLILIHYTPGYSDPMSYLFGSIIMVTKSDLWIVIALDLVILIITTLFYHKFIGICFDEEFSKLRGIRTNLYYILLLVLIALTVVMLINIVGIVMIIALLTIPAGVAGAFAKSIRQMMVIAVLICLFTIFTGLAVSYSLDLPSGPVIIILNSLIYVLTTTLYRKRIH